MRGGAVAMKIARGMVVLKGWLVILAGGWQGHADISEYIFDGIFK